MKKNDQDFFLKFLFLSFIFLLMINTLLVFCNGRVKLAIPKVNLYFGDPVMKGEQLTTAVMAGEGEITAFDLKLKYNQKDWAFLRAEPSERLPEAMTIKSEIDQGRGEVRLVFFTMKPVVAEGPVVSLNFLRINKEADVFTLDFVGEEGVNKVSVVGVAENGVGQSRDLEYYLP